MRIIYLLVLLSLICYYAQGANPTPNFPKAFSTTIDVFRHSQHSSFLGRWFRDEVSKVERFDTASPHGWDIDIRRFDQGKRYNIYHAFDGEVICEVRNLTNVITPINFESYKYRGKVTIRSHVDDEFDSPNGNEHFAKYFQNSASSEPDRLETSGPNDETIDFVEFDAGTQDKALFDVTIVAPNVVCNKEAFDNLGHIRMAWLDAQNGAKVNYYNPPALVFANVTEPQDCESGQASWYDCNGNGACGPCNPSQNEAAHKTVACGKVLTVTDTKSGKAVQVKVGDRGPYVAGRIVDLNHAPAEAIGMISAGVINVRACW